MYDTPYRKTQRKMKSKAQGKMNGKVNSKTLILSSVMLLAVLLNACATANNQAVIERMTPEALAKMLPQPVANLSLDEIVALSQQGASVEDITKKITASHSYYALTPTQTLALSKQGVAVEVLDFIHTRFDAAQQNAIADEMNQRTIKAEQAKKQLEASLLRERELRSDRFYDPYWTPYYGFGYAPFYAPYRGYSSHFGVGVGRGFHR